jgi:hypothetical protein
MVALHSLPLVPVQEKTVLIPGSGTLMEEN